MYSQRAGLQVFFNILWSKDRIGPSFESINRQGRVIMLHTKLKLVISQGKHQEGAWVEHKDVQ